MQVEELFLQFAKKASSFNSWLEDAEEDLTDPVRCNSLEEIRVRRRREDRERGEGKSLLRIAIVYLYRVSERPTPSSRHLRRR